MKKYAIVFLMTILSFLVLGNTAFASESKDSNTEEEINIIEEQSEISPQAGTGNMTIVVNQGYQKMAYGSWHNGVTGSGKANLSLSKNVSVSNTYSGTLTATKSKISSAVGFSLSKSHSTTASYSVDVPKGKKYTIQWRPVYKQYKVRQDSYAGGQFLKTTYVYPKKYDHLEYRYITAK